MGEVSRSEKARQERLAEKPKEKEQVKEKQSEFDKVLQESRTVQKTTPTTQTPTKASTEQAAREAHRREDRSKDEDQRDQKDKDKKGDQSEKRGDAKTADQKVIAKGPMKDGGGGGGKGDKGGFSFGQSRKGVDLKQQKLAAGLDAAALHGKFAQKMQASLAKGLRDPGMTQAILNQLVQYVKVGINQEGDKEIRIELHERIFKGLKLRVLSKEGKVLVHFMAADDKTRAVFDKNKDEIRKALEKKGILVEDILIT